MTARTLGLTDRSHEFLLQVGFRLKRVREETTKLPLVHMLAAPEQAPNSWPFSRGRTQIE